MTKHWFHFSCSPPPPPPSQFKHHHASIKLIFNKQNRTLTQCRTLWPNLYECIKHHIGNGMENDYCNQINVHSNECGFVHSFTSLSNYNAIRNVPWDILVLYLFVTNFFPFVLGCHSNDDNRQLWSSMYKFGLNGNDGHLFIFFVGHCHFYNQRKSIRPFSFFHWILMKKSVFRHRFLCKFSSYRVLPSFFFIALIKSCLFSICSSQKKRMNQLRRSLLSNRKWLRFSFTSSFNSICPNDWALIYIWLPPPFELHQWLYEY